MKHHAFVLHLLLFIFFASFAIYFGTLHFRRVGQLPEPKPKSFRSDEMYFLKIYYLVKQGGNFYTSFIRANVARGGKNSPDVFTWRWPTVFYVWTALAKNGVQVLYLFWLFTYFSWISIYFILKKYMRPMLALAGTMLVLPYFLDAVYYKTSFLFTEWWGWFFLMIALALFIYRKKYLAWAFFLLAVTTRELMMVPIIIYLFISVVSRKNRLFFISLIGSFLILFFIHKNFVAQVMHDQSSFSLPQTLSRIHVPTKTELFQMLSFSMRQYPLAQFKIHLLLALLSLFCLIRLLFMRAPIGLIYIIFSGWSLALFLPFMSGAYNDYWGITFVPSLLMIIPLIFYHKPHEKNAF